MKHEAAAVHKDLRTTKYKLQVVPAKKGKGSFKRDRKINHGSVA